MCELWNTGAFYQIFFFNDTATTEIYTLSLHDALPIFRAIQPGIHSGPRAVMPSVTFGGRPALKVGGREQAEDRKSTRLNSSHANISYAVFCLKKKKIDSTTQTMYSKAYCSHVVSLVGY